MLGVSYMRPDSTQKLVMGTDTLRFFTNRPKAKKNDDKKKKKKKEEEMADTLPVKIPSLDFRMLSQSAQDVDRPLLMEFATPLNRLDTSAFHLQVMIDSVWNDVPLPGSRSLSIPSTPAC